MVIQDVVIKDTYRTFQMTFSMNIINQRGYTLLAFGLCRPPFMPNISFVFNFFFFIYFCTNILVDLCVLQQPKPGEPLYAQVNLEKKKKRQYELGMGGQGQGQTVPGVVGVNLDTAGGQWATDGIQDTNPPTVGPINITPNSTAAPAGDSWV